MTTYAILKADLIDLTENNSSDFATESDQFIDTVELRLSRELRNCPELYKHQTSTLTQSDPFITEYWPTRTSTGSPKFYADWNEDVFIVAPTPSAALTIEINYRKRFTALSSSSTTSWLTEHAYDLLLYGCLIEAAIYDKNPQMMQMYEKRYQEALATVNAELENRRSDQSNKG